MLFMKMRLFFLQRMTIHVMKGAVLTALLILSQSAEATPQESPTFLLQKQASGHYEAAVRYYNNDDYVQAQQEFQQALQLYRRLDHQEQVVNCLQMLGEVNRLLRSYANAIDSFDRALDYFRQGELDNPLTEAETYRLLAWTYYDSTLFDFAVIHFKKAANLYEEMVNPGGRANSFYGIGYSYLGSGDYESAIRQFQSAEAIFRILNRETEQMNCRLQIAKCYYSLEEYEKTIAVIQTFIADLKDQGKKADSYYWLANSFFELQRYAEAISAYEDARNGYRLTNEPQFAAYCSRYLGDCYFDQQKWESANSFYQEAANEFARMDDRPNQIAALMISGHATYNAQNFDDALSSYQLAVELSTKYADPERQAEALQGLGSTYEALTRYEPALPAFDRSADLFFQSGRFKDAAQSALKKGDACVQLEQFANAIAAYNRAVTIGKSTAGLDSVLAESYLKLGEAFRLSGQPERALSQYEQAWILYRNLDSSSSEIAAALEGLGQTYFDMGRFSESSLKLSEAASRYKALGDFSQAARAYYNAGLGSFNMSENDRARQQLITAINLYEQVDDPKGEADARVRLAMILEDIHFQQETLTEYEKAKELYYSVNDLSGVAECHLGLGSLYLNQDPVDLTNASMDYAEAMRIYETAGDSSGWARAVRGLAQIDFHEKHYARANRKFEQAARVHLSNRQPADAALCFENIGNCNYNLQKYDDAIQSYQRALLFYSKANNPDDTARCQMALGDCNLALYQKAANERFLASAWQNFEEAFRYYDGINDYRGLLKSLMGMGDVYFHRKQYGEAQIKYQEALARSGRYVEPKLEVQANYKLAQTHIQMLDFEKALALMDQILSIYSQEGDTLGQLQMVSQQAQLFRKLNQYEKALEFYDKLARLADEFNNSDYIRIAKIDKANLLYLDIGEKEEAKQLYQQALQLAVAANDSSHISACQTGLGNLEYEAGNYETALNYYQDILSLESALGDSVAVGKTYINIGNVYKGLDYLDRAEEYYWKAEKLSERLDLTETIAVSFNNLGTVDLGKGVFSESLDKFTRAERAAEKAYLKRLLITIYANKGVVYEEMGRYQEARLSYEKAVELVEEIRQELKQEKLIISFIKTTADLYDRLIILLIEKVNQPELAFSFIERDNSGELYRFYKAKIQASGNSGLVEQFNELEKARTAKRQTELELQREAAKPIGERNQFEIANLIRLIAKDDLAVTRLDHALRSRDNDYAKMVDPGISQIAGIRSYIPRDATLVLYYPAASKLYIFIATSQKFIAKSVAISREHLYAKVRDYRQTIKEHMTKLRTARTREDLKNVLRIRSWQEDWMQGLTNLTTELHRYLIQPFEHEIDEGNTVIFIPSGYLYYVPLHALAEKQNNGHLRFVLENWTVAYFTSTTFMNSIMGSILHPVSKEKCAQKIVAFGNSDGKLLGVHEEMESLRRYASNSQIYLGLESTEEKVKRLAPQSCFFVISDHCRVNTTRTDETYIQFAASAREDGRWYTHEIETARFPLMNLVVLPNCETAVGEENPTVGVRNLVHSFSVSGAMSIIATLWPVSDFMTPKLLHEFYKNYFQDNLDKAHALREAQLALLRNSETAHPFFWAGFMLYGYWYQDVVHESTASK